jgi:GNAT superfamily N-acetyltransferase
MIRLAETDQQITDCFPTISQLRPHLPEANFIERVRRQMAGGYSMAYVDFEGRPVCVAGYRFYEMMAWGKLMYVDDLVTDANTRSGGHGKEMLDWLKALARERGCDQLHLDSGVQRFDAHRFYLRERMNITSHHFAIVL